jgi:hypothetical protein
MYGKEGKSADMSVKVKDYQPGKAEFAGAMMGKANEYMARTDKRMNKDAGRVKSQAYKGRYD